MLFNGEGDSKKEHTMKKMPDAKKFKKYSKSDAKKSLNVRKVKAPPIASPRSPVVVQSALAAPNPQTIALKNSAIEIATRATLLKVVDSTSLLEANNMLVAIAQAKKNLDAHKQALIKPLNDHIKSITATYFKPAIEPLEQANQTLRDKVIAFTVLAQQRAAKVREAEEAKAMELNTQAEQLAAEGKDEAAAEVAQQATEHAVAAVTTVGPSRVMSTDSSQVTTRTRWEFTVTDPARVPREYLMVNEKAIRAAVNSGTRAIPGVEIKQGLGLAVGGL
jgi:hypothetical protein